MRQFLSFFRQFLKPLANSNTCIFVNIAWKMNCDILKSKLILCEWNAFYFIEIAFIGFTLDEIKQCIVFFGTPGIWISLISSCGFDMANCMFLTGSINFHSFSRDITGLYTVNCYIRKQILYFARQIEGRERFLQQIANLFRWKPSRLLKLL